MAKKQLKPDVLDTFTRAASIGAQSFDPADNSVAVIWSTGASVRRIDRYGDVFNEVLVMTTAACRLSRLNAGAPFLDTHDSSDLSSVIGSVVPGSARIEGGKGVARVQLSTASGDADTVQKIKAGIVKNISVGYHIHKYVEEDGDDGVLVRRVVDWEPLEISAVPIPADPDAQIRSVVTGRNDAAPEDEIENVDDDDEEWRNLTYPGKSPSVPVAVLDTRRAERRAAAIENALLHRDDPANNPLRAEGARDFVGMSLIEVARECLEANGISASGLSRPEIAQAAMQVRDGGMNSVDDFPIIIENILHKSLRAGYTASPQTFRPFTNIGFVADFKEVSRVQLGEAPPLDPLGEHGEFSRGTMGEAAERFAVETFGKIVALTRQVIINDDVGAFTRVPRAFGVQAAQLESDLVWAQILANPPMGDGLPLFHSRHKNLCAADYIDKSSISEAFVRMGLQTGLDGKTVLNLTPAYLIVPKALQAEAEGFLEPLYPTKDGDQVAGALQRLQVITEPRLDLGIERFGIGGDGKAHYFAADPTAIDTVELAYLQGHEGVYTETRMGFDVDGVEIKVRLDVGAKAIDWRGLAKNPGR